MLMVLLLLLLLLLLISLPAAVWCAGRRQLIKLTSAGQPY
jgi:hypothetical protein